MDLRHIPLLCATLFMTTVVLMLLDIVLWACTASPAASHVMQAHRAGSVSSCTLCCPLLLTYPLVPSLPAFRKKPVITHNTQVVPTRPHSQRRVLLAKANSPTTRAFLHFPLSSSGDCPFSFLRVCFRVYQDGTSCFNAVEHVISLNSALHCDYWFPSLRFFNQTRTPLSCRCRGTRKDTLC